MTFHPSTLSAGRDPAVTPGEGSGEVPDGVSACLRGLKAKKRGRGRSPDGGCDGWMVKQGRFGVNSRDT